MRRGVAMAVGALVVVLAAVFGYVTWSCGIRSVTESCSSTEECAAGSTCVSALHPLAPALGAAGVGGIALAWRRQAFPLMLLGTVTAGAGALFVFSAGFLGIGSGLLLALGGAALSDRRFTRIGAPVACVLAPVLGLAAASLGGIPFFYLGVAVPVAAWLGLAIWESGRRQNVGREA